MMEEENRTSLGGEIIFFVPFLFFYTTFSLEVAAFHVCCFKSEAVTSMYCTCGS